ncbi:hypothetical protein JL720_2218 [Aureococcus anophagefferens]|nr:hypothetical protein JL720_2218 [Aureococcus anophagefferens]
MRSSSPLRLCVVLAAAAAFRAPVAPRVSAPRTRLALTREDFEIEVELEQGAVTVQLSPTMEKSELVVAQYPLPFFIDIEQTKDGNMVTKDGSQQENDGVERAATGSAFTHYEVGQSLDEPGGGGVISMLGSFGGASIKWRRKLFDATFTPWDKALEVLITNEPRRTDSVTMVFERRLE